MKNNEQHINNIINPPIPQWSLLNKTLLDILSLPYDKFIKLTEHLEQYSFNMLELPSENYLRMQYNFQILPEDKLSIILNFSIEYIYNIWHDNSSFDKIIGFIYCAIEDVCKNKPKKVNVQKEKFLLKNINE